MAKENYIKFRCSDDFKNLVEQKAKEYGMTVSSYIEHLIRKDVDVMDTREIMIKAVHALLSSGSYDDLNEEQNSVVVEFETEIMKEKVDELRKTMPPEEIKETIHDWWQDYEIADGTEDNLLAYIGG